MRYGCIRHVPEARRIRGQETTSPAFLCRPRDLGIHREVSDVGRQRWMSRRRFERPPERSTGLPSITCPLQVFKRVSTVGIVKDRRCSGMSRHHGLPGQTSFPCTQSESPRLTRRVDTGLVPFIRPSGPRPESGSLGNLAEAGAGGSVVRLGTVSTRKFQHHPQT